MNILKRILNKIGREFRRYIQFGIGNIIMFKSGKLSCNLRKTIFYQPVHIYKDGGSYVIGNEVQFGYDIGGRYKHGYIELQARRPEACINIGHKVAFNNNCTILSCKSVNIGNDCRIGAEVQMLDFDGHGIQPSERSAIGKMAPINIKDNVWIGNRVTILNGTTIGSNCIVAAGAVVKGIFPNNVVIGGVPAQIIKKIEGNSENAETK